MKKLTLLLLALPLIATLITSCDDDNTPDVNVGIRYANAVAPDGTVYLVKGDTLTIDSLWVTAVNTKHNASIVGPVTYLMQGVPLARVIPAPYKFRIPTDSATTGNYTLGVAMNVAEEDCTLASAAVSLAVSIVADSTQIPADALTGGTASARN